MTLLDFLPKFIEALKEQMESDQKRWGDTWKHRPVEGQEERAFARFRDYYDQFINAGIPIPWMKVVGEALICWVRSTQNYKD